jgi:nicotinate-nucleotide adenylyltransferase
MYKGEFEKFRAICMANIALFGGSFNPPHPGHFEMARYIYENLGVDEVWFLFSVNWQKDPADYASTEHRMAMGDILSKHYHDMPFKMSGVQDEMQTHMTYDVLTELSKRHPSDNFVWVMGADQLATFHTWENYDRIIQEYPVAIVDRPGYTEDALNSVTAKQYDGLRVDNPSQLSGALNGWCLFDNPKLDLSSSALLKALRAGQRAFDAPFQDVADYIVTHGLLGVEQDGAVPPILPPHSSDRITP